MGRREFKTLVKQVRRLERPKTKRTRTYYKIGRYLKKGYNDPTLTKYTKGAARRTYKFYKGTPLAPYPSPRDLYKMNKPEFIRQRTSRRQLLVEQAPVEEGIVLRSPIVSPNYDLQLPTTPEASLSDEATILLSPRYNTVEQESAQALLILSDTDGHGSPLHCVDCYIRSLDEVELAAQGHTMEDAFNAIDWPEWPTSTTADHRLPTSIADHRIHP